MDVVLPGEAHAPQDLDGPLGGLDIAVQGQVGGELHGEAHVVPGLGGGAVGRGVPLIDLRGRVPGRGHPLLDGDEHVGQSVLHRLELADRPPELVAGARMLGCRIEAPAGTADGLGRCDHQCQVADPAGRCAGQDPLGWHPGALQHPGRRRPGGIEAGHGLDRGSVAPFEQHPLHRVAHGDRGQHQRDHRPVGDGP